MARPIANSVGRIAPQKIHHLNHNFCDTVVNRRKERIVLFGEVFGPDLLIILIVLAFPVLTIIGSWKIFAKADEPGWSAIIPIYSQYTLCRVIGRPVWWLIFLLIPYLNIVFWLIFAMDLAKVFSRSKGFGIGLWLLPFIFVPILGLGGSVYRRPLIVSRD